MTTWSITWIAIVLLATASFVMMAVVLKVPRIAWTAVAATLVLGLSGYAFQGQPDLPDVPRMPQGRGLGDPVAMVAARKALAGPDAPIDDSRVMIADAFARHAEYADAAGILLGAVEKQPDNAQAWLALGNALVGHADGVLTPAAAYAYRRAALAAPDQPGPPFFLGLALAQSGRLAEAHDQWAAVLAHAPPNAVWRANVTEELRRLDMLMAAQAAMSGGSR